MTLSVDIHPSSSTLCMINEPDISTAYSLSGHVSISLSPNSDRPHVEKVLLRSLILVFEGQAELITNETGYSAVRLCRLTRELAPSRAVLLSSDGHEDTDTPSVWNFVFDMPIPGWLPSSSVYGNGMGGATGTSYALYAEARYTPLEDGLHSRGWSLSSLCAPFVPRVRSSIAPRKEIEIIRYTTPAIFDELTPSQTPPMAFPNVQYAVKPRNTIKSEIPEGSRIPPDIFRKIELRAAMPECVDMDTESFLLTLRLRTTELTEEQRERLRLVQFRLILSQHETYSRRPFRSYLSAYPLPSSQPDTDPLLNTHGMKGLFDIGLTSINFPDGLITRMRSSFTLLSEKQMSRHSLPDGGIPLQPDINLKTEQVWTRVDVCVPFERVSAGEDDEWEHQHARFKALRPDEESPFLRVEHDLEVELTFTYDDDSNAEGLSIERMSFSLPVRFARVPAVKSQDSDSLMLPPYSQLFHSNGERRTDNTAPLPAYSPHEEPVTLQSHVQPSSKS